MDQKNEKNKPRMKLKNYRGPGLLILALIIVGVILWDPFIWGESGPVKGPKAVALGKTLFAKNCQSCHGLNGVGQDPTSPKGGRKDGKFLAPAVNGTGHTWHHPPKMLFNIIKNGSLAKTSPMKGWKGKMKDKEIWAVLAYFQSIWPKNIQLRYRQAFGG